MDDTLVGLDIGTSTVTVAIGEYDEANSLNIVGVGKSRAHGLRRGVIVNIDAALASVVEAVELAEQMAGHEVHEVIVGISSGHTEGFNSRGVVAVTGKGREIVQNDVDRVIEAAKAVVIPMDREVLHVIPQEFIIDDQKGIKTPKGMIGVRLESEVHIITGSTTTAQNLVKCINRAGFKVEQLVLESLAAAEAVLTSDEQELGVVMIDLGGGTSNLVLYFDGAPYYSSVLPLGAAQITSDLSIMFKTSLEAAERLKIENGCCRTSMVTDNAPIIIPGVAGRPPLAVKHSELAAVIEPRMHELLSLARNKISHQGYIKNIGGGVVLTGGGALLPGVADLAQEIFHSAARVGQPINLGGVYDQYRHPDCSTAVGLVLYADRFRRNAEGRVAPGERSADVGQKVRKWLRNFFE